MPARSISGRRRGGPMRTITPRLFSKCMCLVVAPALAIVMGDLVCVLAQSSVERIETTQEARQPIDSSIRAREAVQKPNETQVPSETGRVSGGYSWTSAMEIGHRFVGNRG